VMLDSDHERVCICGSPEDDIKKKSAWMLNEYR